LTSAHGGGDSACNAIAKRETILLIPRKAVPKAKQDAFEHICGKRRTVVNQLSDRQRASAQRMPTCATRIVCRVIYAQLPCACLSPFSLQACRLARRRSRRCVHLLIFVLAHVCVGAGGKEDSSAHVYSGSAYMQTWVFVSVHGCCFSDTDDVHATILFPHTHCVMRTCECIWAARWVCTHVSQHVGACIPLFCDTQRTLGTDKFQ